VERVQKRSGAVIAIFPNMARFPRFMPLVAVFCALLLFSCDIEPQPYGGKGNDIANYRIKQIGEQVWMAENFDYNVSGSLCYGNSEANCATYGMLYDWATAMALPDSCNYEDCSSQISAKHRGICPGGWHIPSDAEWKTLMHFAGFFTATELKATSGWNEGGNGTDVYGFSALPGGCYSSDIYYFCIVGYYGSWWSSSEDDRGYAYCPGMLSKFELAVNSYVRKSDLFSVRCLQD